MFSKRMAFNFLEDIAQEFYKNYGRKVNSVTRPYAFIEFDMYISKARKSLTDRRKNINSINTQLQDVQRIMVQNIDDVLQRGTVLSGGLPIGMIDGTLLNDSTHSRAGLQDTEPVNVITEVQERRHVSEQEIHVREGSRSRCSFSRVYPVFLGSVEMTCRQKHEPL